MFSKLTRLSNASQLTRTVTKRFYDAKVIDHYENPRNGTFIQSIYNQFIINSLTNYFLSYHSQSKVGSFNKNDPNVGTGLVGAPACGDVMKLQIRVDDATGEILEAKFKTFGCGSAIASSSYVTTQLAGLKVWDATKIKNTHIAKELSLPPVKLHCSSNYIH